MHPTTTLIPGFAALLLLAAATAAHAACLPAGEEEPARAPADDRAAGAARATADALLDALRRVNGVPGLGAAVTVDGRVAWTGCSGWRDLESRAPVTRDTVFRLASVSKVFAATAAARLAEQGRLDLDAPVQQRLAWLRNDWAPISLRQLFAHTSGLAHYTDADQGLGQRRFPSGRDAVNWFAARPLQSPPGDRYRYSSWGYTLAGAVMESATGQPFPALVSAEVAPGLRIQADTGGEGEDVSRLYSIDGARPVRLPATNISYTWPGGGLAGTPESVAMFGARLMAGDIVGPRTWQAMRVPERLADGSAAGERDFRVGLGWRIGRDADGEAIAHHAGVIEGGRSVLVLWPEARHAVALLSNAIWVSSIERTATVLAAPFRTPPPGLEAATCPAGALRYEGTMAGESIGGDVSFRIEHGRCVGVLMPEGALEARFASARAWPGRRLELVALEADGGLSRAALATPFGLYELRAQGGRWRGRLVDADLVLQFLP